MNRGSGSEGALIMPKLPTVPQKVENVEGSPNANNYYLGSDGYSVDSTTGEPSGGGRPSWKSMDDILSRLTALETRLDGASIDAQCQNGTVTVTLNL